MLLTKDDVIESLLMEGMVRAGEIVDVCVAAESADSHGSVLVEDVLVVAHPLFGGDVMGLLIHDGVEVFLLAVAAGVGLLI